MFPFCLLDLNSETPLSVPEQEGSRHIKFQKKRPEPLLGNLNTQAMKNGCLAATSLAAFSVSVAYQNTSTTTVPFLKLLPGSIFISTIY